MSDAPAPNLITVRAACMMFEGVNMTGDLLSPGDTFVTTRERAAELKTNNLIEYVVAEDEAPELLQASLVRAMQAELTASTDALAAAVAANQLPPV